MINIAVDATIGQRRIKQLKSMGYKVVCMAGEVEPDDVWMNRAFINDALFVISPDMDIPKIIEEERYPMVWISFPHWNKDLGCSLISHVDRTIKFKLQFFHHVALTHG